MSVHLPARSAGPHPLRCSTLPLALALALALAPTAEAALVQLDVSGAFHASLRQPALTSPDVQIAEGSTVSLSFRVDTGTADRLSESQFGDFFGAVTEATMSMTSTTGQAVTVRFGVDTFQRLPSVITADDILWYGLPKDRLAIDNGYDPLAWHFTLELLAANSVGLLSGDAMPADAAEWAQVWALAQQRTLQLEHLDVASVGCCTTGIAGSLSGLSLVATDIDDMSADGGGGTASVPEPGGLAVLGLSLALAFGRRRS